MDLIRLNTIMHRLKFRMALLAPIIPYLDPRGWFAYLSLQGWMPNSWGGELTWMVYRLRIFGPHGKYRCTLLC